VKHFCFDFRNQEVERNSVNVHDFETVQQVLLGNADAFRPLVEQYQRMVHDTIVRMVYNSETARDLTQEVFVKAYTKLHTYDPKYPFRVWIHRIAINRAIDFLRRRKPEYLIIDESSDPNSNAAPFQIPDHKPTPDKHLESLENSERIKRAVYSLEPKLKAIIVLRHFRDLNYEQIAETLGIPLGTVKNRLFRAREKLQTILTGEDVIEGVVQR
jgi:RNA polymerase sigma-70 factor, ECF subfamily